MDPTMCQELLTFLTPETRADLKSQALEYILGLSGTREGRQTLCTAGSALLPVLLDLTLDASPAVIQDAYHVMVNLTSDSVIHQALLQNIPTLLPTLLERLRDPACVYADFACTALCNLSREEDTCRSVLGALHVEGMDHLLHMVSNPKYNPTARLEYLSPLICNLTQLPEGRTFILDRTRCIVQRLLPYTHSVSSTVRRGGVVGTLRNCCFNHRDHSWLLGEDVDLLPFLLLPLAGGEEYSEEEMETLPPDLQYLPEDKQRESDPDIRKMLIESIQLLCATPEGRRIVKQRGSYLIMRSLHSWETETDVRIACEKLVQVLISDEPAPGLENLLEVNIPAEVEEKLKLLDEEDEKAQQHTEGTSKENKVTI
ncbi:HGH1 homolog [Pelobates cultripes]|uniref:Protein HGH1 homolog n=1 Tax=Pelobates cultripes TaxID=61616 RepID=A0AAD1S552_PELCU|nr:HGH1 homolog [Pelobates cultripes]